MNANEEKGTAQDKRSLLRRGLDAIFGYDFFISYTRRDGGSVYAENLARRMEAAGFNIFFDSDDYAMGDDWKAEGHWALRRTSQLILVASPEALSSPPVVREVSIYSRLPKRRIVPIDFGGTIRNRDDGKPVFEHLAPEILFIEEEPARLGGDPSDFVVQKLQDGFHLKRQDAKRARIFAIAAAVFAVVGALAVVGGLIALQQRNQALLQAGHVEWERAVSARDTEGNDIHAAHLFASAARSFDAAGREQLTANSLIASEESGRHIIATLPHDVPVMDTVLIDSGILTWAGDGTSRLWDPSSGELLRSHSHDVEGRLPDGAALLTDGSLAMTWRFNGGTVRLWDVDKERPIRGFEHGFEARSGWGINGATFDETGARVLSWSDNGTVWLWDASDGRLVRSFDQVRARGASFGGENWVATWSWDVAAAKLWNLGGDQHDAGAQHELYHPGIDGVRFCGDQLQPISWGGDSVRVWDAATGQLSHDLEHEAVAGTVCYDGGATLLTWGSDGAIRRWEMGDFYQEFTAPEETALRGASLSADRSRVLGWDGDGAIRLWDGKTGRLLATYRHEPGTAVAGAIMKDKETVVSWGADGTVRVWDAAERGASETFAHTDVAGAALDDDESRLLTWSPDGLVKVWEIEGNQSQQSPGRYVHRVRGAGDFADTSSTSTPGEDGVIFEEVVTLEVTEDEGVISEEVWTSDATEDDGLSATSFDDTASEGVIVEEVVEREASESGDFYEYKLSGALFGNDRMMSWDELGRLSVWDIGNGDGPVDVIEHGEHFFSTHLVFSEDRSQVLSWREDGEIAVSKLGHPPAVSHSTEEKLLGASLLDGGTRVLSWAAYGVVQLWDQSGLKTFKDDEVWIRQARFIGEDHRTLFAHSDDENNKTMRLWDVSQPNRPREWFGNEVDGAQVNERGSWVLSWGADRIERWDLAPAVELRDTYAHLSVDGVVLSSDETRMLSWSGDGTVHLWDLDQGGPLKTLTHPYVRGAAFNRCGTQALTWGGGAAHLWDLKIGPSRAKGCSHVARDVQQAKRDLEARSAASINDQGAYRLMKLDHWRQIRGQDGQ